MRISDWFVIALIAGSMSMNFLSESATPPQLKGVRFKPDSVGTEVILDMTQMPKDLKIESNGEDELKASFSGGLAPGVKPTLKRFTQPNLQQVYWESTRGKVQVFLKMKLADAASVYPLHRPDRVIFHVKNNFSGIVKQHDLAQGVKHTKMTRATSRGPILINVLEVNPRDPSIEIVPALASGRMNGKARAETIARRNNAIAGINGSYFKPDKGIPLGLMIIDEELITGPLFERVALGVTQNNHLRMSRVGMRGEIVTADNSRIQLDNVNQPRTSTSQVVLYTSRWGSMAPQMPRDGIQIQLSNGHVVGFSTTESMPVPQDGYVISGPATQAMAALAGQGPQTPVAVSFYTIPDWSDVKHAISGGPFLVRNGSIYIDTKSQRINFKESGSYAPRTAAGITQEGNLILVTVDGRQRGVSVGVSLTEMAALMKEFGAVDAMNLDGGSSTQMVVEGRLVNSPSVPNGVAVSNCLIIRHTSEASSQH